ncbi:MAG TPA: hypothetical protein HPQ00_05345, partial [Magnetococcales bacterium]|nr:hypothetical protein [Magnetococcales bacterium]
LLFENGEDALQEAMQQRLSTIYHPAIPALQICYYVGKPVAIKPIPDNLIHIPNSSLVNYFIATPNRHPTRFVGSSKNSEERQIFFIKSMKKIFENIKIKRRMFISALSAKLQERQPDFNGEMPYRIFLTASRYSTVTQYAVKNLMKAFSRLGCETFLLIEKDGMQDYGQSLSYPLKFLEFNPNVVVHINDPLNQYFHPDLINVVWYQDLVTSVTQHHPVIWRERDLVYATDSLLAREVKKCGEVACSIQFPCVDHWSMETNEPTRREEKIVFIGSSYDNRKYLITSMEVQKYVIYITRQLEEGILFDEIRLVELSREFSLSYFQAYKLFNAVVRNLVVSWVCKYSPIPVEIYGADWDTDFMVRPCWKGVLPHGPELYRVYRSAKYALEANATTLHSQRLAEMSLCGCIPVVYDSRAFVEDSPHLWDNEILFFASTGELCHCLTTAPKGDPRKIGADMTYERFAKRLLERFDTLIGRQKNLPNETLPNGLPHL